jgi:hypothetical protein
MDILFLVNIYDIHQEQDILSKGFRLTEKIQVKDFEVSKLDKEFLSPASRDQHCTIMVMARIYR